MKKTFRVPVEWVSFGWVEIEAESKEGALKKFWEDFEVLELPYEKHYVDGSFNLEGVRYGDMSSDTVNLVEED